MHEVEISKDNSFNVWFDDTYIVWTRLINSKLYTIKNDYREQRLLKTLSVISKLNDEDFILLCKLSSTSDEGDESNIEEL